MAFNFLDLLSYVRFLLPLPVLWLVATTIPNPARELVLSASTSSLAGGGQRDIYGGF